MGCRPCVPGETAIGTEYVAAPGKRFVWYVPNSFISGCHGTAALCRYGLYVSAAYTVVAQRITMRNILIFPISAPSTVY